MSFNFCTSLYQPIFQCFEMQLQGYTAENLGKDFAQNHGFLTDPLQRPPVDLYIRFPFNIDLQHIYLSPSISNHRSTSLEISVHHQIIDEQTSWLIDPSARSRLSDIRPSTFYRVVQIWNLAENIRRIEIFNRETSSSNSDTATYRFSSLTHLTNCSTIKMTIKRTWRGSCCALKYLQIWGTISPSSIKAQIERILFPPVVPPPVSPVTTTSTSEIPSDFLDALTCDLMLIPMLLPSGYLIDRTTLEKCITEDHRWCRPPRDPFTLKAFTESTQPVVAQELKLRIDRFLSEKQDRAEYRQYGRVLDPTHSDPNKTKKRKWDDEQ